VHSVGLGLEDYYRTLNYATKVLRNSSQKPFPGEPLLFPFVLLTSNLESTSPLRKLETWLLALQLFLLMQFALPLEKLDRSTPERAQMI
jgi:hypothetical protein